jgi:chromate reductase
MKILAFSGSLRRDSHNAGLLRAAAELAPPGVELVIYEGLADVPAYDADMEPVAPASVSDLREAIAGADGVLFATPEYNGSIPGFLKNALDWVSRPLATNPMRNLPTAVMGSSTGAFGAVWAQAELRKVLGLLGARVVDRDLPVGMAKGRFDDGGNLIDDEVRGQVDEHLQVLIDAVRERQQLLAQAA